MTLNNLTAMATFKTAHDLAEFLNGYLPEDVGQVKVMDENGRRFGKIIIVQQVQTDGSFSFDLVLSEA